ncbi:ATP-dependent RNA helicase HrpB [Corynebacterium heidelbergense]|nr:ATP-dependent RNA helicase HrpB [Corynebacterium heidelbergense]
MAAIRDHQVVIVAGETGSGKTTQIPKMCLDLGRGRRQVIGHTQPRRLAARSVAERIAEEMGTSVGEPGSSVGYKIRFDDTISQSTAVKLMTDGVLLNEIQRDRTLKAYDTIIIDEAHERSLNIDFLLGYLKQLLPRRPDLKIIITSATIDPESFAQHFSDSRGNPAPIIEVSGRTFPVEIRYRPLTTEIIEDATSTVRTVERDPLEALTSACRELMSEGDGDILCFFSGEREIRDAAEALEGEFNGGGGRPGSKRVDILPLFGRLSNQEQHRVFHPGGRRRIVLATNIAETSLTVPGIHYVVDTGLARISRYSSRTKVQRLPVEEISQASAKQRSGRCGRIADGIAIRLYSQEDFEARPEFTDPEILRTHLASVILAMAALGLGDIYDFPFVLPPDKRAVKDGIALLVELGALDEDKGHRKRNATGDDGSATGSSAAGNSGYSLTPVGRDLARIPADPRLARMLVAAHAAGVVDMLAVLVAALSIQDIRERPLEHQARADQLHARFASDSDFTSIILLWNYIQTRRKELSGNQFRKLCREEFLHYVRAREWMDLVRQFLSIVQDLGWEISYIPHVRELVFDPTALNEDVLHQCVLSGMVSHIGMREGNSRQFLGTRNSHFVIHPSSQLAKKPPQWIIAAELVETSQVFARTVGPCKPEWVEQVAGHMTKATYSEPYWSAKRSAAMIHEKIMLLGLPIIADRVVSLSKVDRPQAREMFIRRALVEGDWRTHHRFFAHNQEVLAEASQLEDKARRRNIVVDDETLYNFYDARLPESVVSARHFDSWWKKARHGHPHLLDFDLDALIESPEAAAAAGEFPDTWIQGSLRFDLSYVFEPGRPDDGITMRVPLPLLATVDEEQAQWLVAGMREELCVALIRSLPKALRKSVVPASNFAAAALGRMSAFDGPIDRALADALRALGGTGIDAEDFDWSKVPPHLRVNVAAIDRHGKVVAASRDISQLKADLSGQITQAIAKASAQGRMRGAGHGAAGSDGRTGGQGAQDTRNGHGAAAKSGSSGGRGTGSKGRRGAASSAGMGGDELTRAAKWTAEGIGVIPEHIETIIDGQPVQAYPAILAQDGAMIVRAFPTKQAAAAQQFKTVLDLMVTAVRVQPQQMIKGLPLRQRVAMGTYASRVGTDSAPSSGRSNGGSKRTGASNKTGGCKRNGGAQQTGVAQGVEGLVADCVAVACRDILTSIGPVLRDPDEADRAIEQARQKVPGMVRQMVVAVAPAILAVEDLRAELREWSGPIIKDIQQQLGFYLPQHAVARHGVGHLKHVPRYVAAVKQRLEDLEAQPDRDEDLEEQVRQAFEYYRATVDRLPSARAHSPQLKEVRWMIEELRVSLFAQNLGTTRSVSVARIRKALEKIR